MKKPVYFFWFRRDLRVEDNHGLYKALTSGVKVIPLFIFDSDILDGLSNREDKRITFIWQRLKFLNEVFRSYNSSLMVRHGKPVSVFRELLGEHNIKKVYACRDYEPYGIDRDQQVSRLLEAHQASLEAVQDQVVFEKSQVVKSNGEPYQVFTPYSRAWKARLKDHPPGVFPAQEHLGSLLPESFPFPELEDLGFKEVVNPGFPADDLSDAIISTYHKNRDYPARNGTSRLGVHLRFGTISIRQCVNKALEINETWLNELIWREFFMMILYHHPEVVTREYNPKYRNIPWRRDENDFERWKEGTTGYPMVDAGMRELKETGYMHNRLRMITAGFLARHLLIDWRMGEAWFAEKLLDYELASNNGNWQWAAGTGCDASPWFRIFNPITQHKKFDPDSAYVKQWIPEYDTSKYPHEMIPHREARERTLEVFRKALG